MKTIAILAAASLGLLAAMPASADNRRHGNSKPLIDVGATVGGKHNPLASVDATVKGVANVDADILSSNRKGTSILDLNANVGKLGANLDLDISKKKGLDLDLNVGKSRGRSNGGHGNYDFGGGVGN